MQLNETAQGSTEARMREFLGAMEGGKQPASRSGALQMKVPTLLMRAARKSVHGTPAARDVAAVEDIASAVLEQIVRRKEAAALAVLPGKKLRAALGKRCRQAAAELWPRWNLRKQLREHVVRALETVGEVEVAPLPVELLSDGRFCAAHVTDAVRALLTAAVPARRHPTELTAALMKIYFAPETALDDVDHLQSDHVLQDEVHFTARHAPLLATGLRRLLGADLSRILSLQLLGRKLREIADEVGLAIATVHARLKECERKLRAYQSRAAASIELMRAALQQFVLQCRSYLIA